jgi:hypothetical protein
MADSEPAGFGSGATDSIIFGFFSIIIPVIPRSGVHGAEGYVTSPGSIPVKKKAMCFSNQLNS